MSNPPFAAVPCCNRRQLIGARLDRILAQNDSAFEVIVSDDAARDRTAEIARAGNELEQVAALIELGAILSYHAMESSTT